MMAMPSELDSISPRKSSSLRTRSSVTRPSSRMRSTRRRAMRPNTTARPASAPVESCCSPKKSTASAAGRLSIATTTSSMPSGVTCGAPARGPWPENRVGANPAAITTVITPPATDRSEPAVHAQDGEMIAMASKTAAAAMKATAPIMTLTDRRSSAVETVHSAPAPPSMTAA